ncbi:MAG: hypothetical protein H0W07_02430 [Chloroflexi bacterium]|nr:hypothetical protein [Chloroflexota bacterium]
MGNGHDRIGAAVDVGSNSVHLVVGSIDGTDGRTAVTAMVDESELLGLGDVVDAHGEITPEAQERLIIALHRYATVAQAYAARHLTIVATEPLRRAANRELIQAHVHAATGLDLQVLRHEDEGLLTLLGVTGGATVERPLLVVDIGGGSSEFVLASPTAPPQVGALATGSARLTKQLVSHDPPTAIEIEALREEALELVATTPEGRVERAVMVGGTATNLLKVAASQWGETLVDHAALAEAYAVIGSTPADEISERYVINRRRAGMLAAGAALVEAFMDRFGIAIVEVSRVSLREGAILARERAGVGWLAELSNLAVRAS